MNVSFITDPELKESITLSVMHQLPLWFSPPEDIDYKAKTHRNYPFFAVLDQGQPVAFAAVKIHNPYTADKTLDESADYPPYDGTRAFYRKEGFLPLEVFPTFWDEGNPCLFLARTVK